MAEISSFKLNGTKIKTRDRSALRSTQAFGELAMEGEPHTEILHRALKVSDKGEEPST